MIFKQGKAVNKNTQLRLVTLTQHKLRWYHNEKEEKNDEFLGCVSLPFIMGVVKSKQERNERPAFMIAVTMYID